MTALGGDNVAPLVTGRDRVDDDDLLVMYEIDRLNIGKFRDFAKFAKTVGVNADSAERIYQHYGVGAIQVVR